MASYEYRYCIYSFQGSERAQAAEAAINAMSADGWHVHTCVANFIEVAILWERGGSASADRVRNHFEETGVLPVPAAEPPAPRKTPRPKPKSEPAGQ